MSITENIMRVRGQIDSFETKAGVPNGSVELIAVSKTMPADKIQEAYDAGQRSFGENRVQEFLSKQEELPKDIRWNLIGRLQTNKVKYIISKDVYLLHSLDRIDLAKVLQQKLDAQGARLDALVQLNLSREDTKSGIYEEDLDAFMQALAAFPAITVKGFMTIGPMVGGEKEIREVFRRAKGIYDRFAAQSAAFQYLSMGMSHDFEWAIMEGSNMVRVGSAVFGERDYQ